MDNSQDLIITRDFNSIDLQDYESNKVGMVKPNDIRVLRHAKIQSKLSELVLQDIGKLNRPIHVIHYDKRSTKHSRIDYIFGNLENVDLNLITKAIPFSDHKILHLNLNVETFHHGNWKVNDNTLQDSESVNEILRTTIPILGRAKNISKVYDIFKAKFRDLLRLLCIKKNKIHREEKKLEKDLSFKTQKLEKENSTKQIYEEQTKMFNDLDQLQDELQKLKENQAKVQMTKIKNYFAEANEGDP